MNFSWSKAVLSAWDGIDIKRGTLLQRGNKHLVVGYLYIYI